MLELTGGLKALLKETAERLKGHERRRFMAQTVEELGRGGQRLAEKELGWHRDLIRKGKREVEICHRVGMFVVIRVYLLVPPKVLSPRDS